MLCAYSILLEEEDKEEDNKEEIFYFLLFFLSKTRSTVKTPTFSFWTFFP